MQGTKGEGGFKCSQSVQQHNLNLTMQLVEEMKRFSKEGDNVKRMGKCGPQNYLTLNLLRTTIVAPPSNASKWQMGFNSAFKGLNGPT